MDFYFTYCTHFQRDGAIWWIHTFYHAQTLGSKRQSKLISQTTWLLEFFFPCSFSLSVQVQGSAVRYLSWAFSVAPAEMMLQANSRCQGYIHCLCFPLAARGHHHHRCHFAYFPLLLNHSSFGSFNPFLPHKDLFFSFDTRSVTSLLRQMC